jgi:autotransporter-associated beta strand protein
LVIESNNQPIMWASNIAGIWDTLETSWKDGEGTVTAYSQTVIPGDQVMFNDDHISATTTVTLTNTVSPANVTANNSANKYILSGSGGIIGNTSLTKSGSGIFTLGTANSYSGGTFLSAGTLALGNASALPAGRILSMSGTGTLDLGGYGGTVANISASTAANIIIDNSEGPGTNTLTITAQTTTLSALIKNGPSKAVAIAIANNNSAGDSFPNNTPNTYSGGLTLKNNASGTRLRIMSQVVTVGTPGNITSSPFGRGPIIIGEAVTDKAQILFDSFGTNTVVNDIIVNSPRGTDAQYSIRADLAGYILSGTVTANSEFSFGGTATGTLTISNEVSGAGGVRVVSGTLTLPGPNTYTGKTIVSGGTLTFNTLGNMGEAASSLGAPTTPASRIIDLNAILMYNGAGSTSDRILNLTGGSGTLNHAGTGPLTLTGGITGSNVSFLFRGGGTIVESGPITIGSGQVTRTDPGTLYLTYPLNPFTGLVKVADGTISIDTIADSGQLSPLGAGTTIQLGQGTATTGKLQFTGPTGGSCNRAFTVNGTTTTSGGIIENTVAGQTLSLSGNITGTGSSQLLQLIGAGDGVISGSIGSAGGMVVTKSGAGTWTLSGANTYSGITTVIGGTLDVSGSLGNGGVTLSTGTGVKVIARNTAALGAGEIWFSDAGGTGATPILEVKVNGGGVIAFPNNLRASSLMVDTINVDNDGEGTGGIVQFNGALSRWASSTFNITGANGYSLYIANLTDIAGAPGTMTLNPTTAALGIGNLSGYLGTANNYMIALSGTHPSNTIDGVISDKSGSGNTTIAITKQNSSTWTLSGTSTYTGATAISGGKLVLAGADGSILGTSALSISG